MGSVLDFIILGFAAPQRPQPCTPPPPTSQEHGVRAHTSVGWRISGVSNSGSGCEERRGRPALASGRRHYETARRGRTRENSNLPSPAGATVPLRPPEDTGVGGACAVGSSSSGVPSARRSPAHGLGGGPQTLRRANTRHAAPINPPLFPRSHNDLFIVYTGNSCGAFGSAALSWQSPRELGSNSRMTDEPRRCRRRRWRSDQRGPGRKGGCSGRSRHDHDGGAARPQTHRTKRQKAHAQRVLAVPQVSAGGRQIPKMSL